MSLRMRFVLDASALRATGTPNFANIIGLLYADPRSRIRTAGWQPGGGGTVRLS